jgi:hypothetical protein
MSTPLPKRDLPVTAERLRIRDALKWLQTVSVKDISRNELEVMMDRATQYDLRTILRFIDNHLTKNVTALEFAANLNAPNIEKLQAMAEAFDSVNDAAAELLDQTSNLPTFADSSVYIDFVTSYYNNCCQLLLAMTNMSGKNPILKDMFMPQIFLIGYDLSKMFLVVNGSKPNMPLQSDGATTIAYYAFDDAMNGRVYNTDLAIPVAPIADYINVTSNNFSAFVQLSSLKLYGAWDNGGNTNFAEIVSGTTGGATLNANFTSALVDANNKVSIPFLYRSVTTGSKTVITDNSDDVYICLADLAGLDPENFPGWSGLALDVVKNLEDESQFIPLSAFHGQYYVQKIFEVDAGNWYLDPNTVDSNLPDYTFATKLTQYLNDKQIFNITYVNKRPAVVNGKAIKVIDFPTKHFENTHTYNIKSTYDMCHPAPLYFTSDETVNNPAVIDIFGQINTAIPSFLATLANSRNRCLTIVKFIENENKTISAKALDVYNNFDAVRSAQINELKTTLITLDEAIGDNSLISNAL